MTEDLQYRVYEKLLLQTGKDHEESCRGFIKVLNRRATEFDTRVKNWQGREDLVP